MTGPTLHDAHDPLCGWCYAVAPLIEAVAAAGIPVVLHGAGLWDQVTSLTPEKRAYIRQNDARIATLTGQPFGSAYWDGLLAAPDTVLWSRPTIAAVLAAGTLAAGADLAMLHAVQRAHYVAGRRVIEPTVLTEIAAGLGLAGTAFQVAFDGCAVDAHIAESRAWMGRLGLRGFPSFAVAEGATLISVRHEAYYGRAAAFVGHLATLAVPPTAA